MKSGWGDIVFCWVFATCLGASVGIFTASPSLVNKWVGLALGLLSGYSAIDSWRDIDDD